MARGKPVISSVPRHCCTRPRAGQSFSKTRTVSAAKNISQTTHSKCLSGKTSPIVAIAMPPHITVAMMTSEAVCVERRLSASFARRCASALLAKNFLKTSGGSIWSSPANAAKSLTRFPCLAFSQSLQRTASLRTFLPRIFCRVLGQGNTQK